MEQSLNVLEAVLKGRTRQGLRSFTVFGVAPAVVVVVRPDLAVLLAFLLSFVETEGVDRDGLGVTEVVAIVGAAEVATEAPWVGLWGDDPGVGGPGGGPGGGADGAPV